jgi:hypothetical protein
MDPSRENPREHLRQAIDTEIESFEGSIRALRRRRNALAPISSLPTEVITAIFFFLRVPPSSSTYPLGEKPDRLAWLRVAHVYHQWREIALNQPLFWSHVNFITFSSAGVTEILDRAKTAPLHLEARVPLGRWGDAQCSAFRKELQARISHLCHLGITAEYQHLRKTLEGLVSPAPILEYLSLCSEEAREIRVFVPDTLFDGTTPRLSCLELRNCDISWKSPLLKGLRHLEIRKLTANARQSLSVWLDALDEMPQLKTLTLHSASPISHSVGLPSDLERTITLPFLARLDISASARDCGLALAHLILPALTQLCLTTGSCQWDSRESASDVQDVLPYISQYTHGPQHTRPIQSVLVCSYSMCVEILAWTLPDIDIELTNQTRAQVSFLGPVDYVRMAFSVTNMDLSPGTHTRIFDAAVAAFPLDSVVTLTTERYTLLDERFWLSHTPKWSLLRRVRLAPPAARGFTGVLLEDNGGRENPLLPSLTTLILLNTALSAPRTLRLCDTFMKRVDQGVPLETLDLRTCLATCRAVELLSEIVVDVLCPEEALKTMAETVSKWDLFVPDTGSNDESWHDWETDAGRYEYEDEDVLCQCGGLPDFEANYTGGMVVEEDY